MASKRKKSKKRSTKRSKSSSTAKRSTRTNRRARAMLGNKPVSMHLVVGALRGFRSAATESGSLTKMANPAAASASVDHRAVAAPAPIPAVFPCAAGDQLRCVYTVAGAIVAEAVLFHAPDENGDGVGDRLDEIGRAQASRVAGETRPLAAGWSYLIWDFHPANQNAWSATLEISVNGGPLHVFGETSGDEASHHQAGMLIWAEPNA